MAPVGEHENEMVVSLHAGMVVRHQHFLAAHARAARRAGGEERAERDGTTADLLRYVEGIAEHRGVDLEVVSLRDLRIVNCGACGDCNFRPLPCMVADDVPDVVARMIAADGIIFAGAVPHAEMPAHLAAADIGAAPFDPAAHGPLSLGFYWSPLKIFEYMATGLPVVAPALDRIAALVQHGREGLLYTPPAGEGMAAAVEQLMDHALRSRLGAAARARAAAEFSWAAHCEKLESAIDERRKKPSPVR